MRLTKSFALALVPALFLLSCGGGQPRYYRISINRSALEALPASCFAGGVVPATTDKSTSVVDIQQWSIWDGTDNRLYLVVGDMSGYTLGNAESVRVNGDAIEGASNNFTATRERVNAQRTIKSTVTIAFTDLSATAKGTLTLNSETTCTNCGTPTCAVTLPFSGRKLDADPMMIYTPAP